MTPSLEQLANELKALEYYMLDIQRIGEESAARDREEMRVLARISELRRAPRSTQEGDAG